MCETDEPQVAENYPIHNSHTQAWSTDLDCFNTRMKRPWPLRFLRLRNSITTFHGVIIGERARHLQG